MPEWFWDVVYPLPRWLHVVSAALLVGGTLFYEFVVPVAIEDEKDEHQLGILGRARWVFRKVVYLSTIFLILSGIANTYSSWCMYKGMEPHSPRPFWVLHVGLGIIGITIALRLTIGGKIPRNPLLWMRINFVLLMVVILLAGSARQVQQVQLANYRKAQRLGGQAPALKVAPGLPPGTAPGVR